MANRSDERSLQARGKQEVETEGTRPGLVFRPDVDILERADGYVVYADLPGSDEQSIDVRLDNGVLTIDARLATHPDTDWNPLHVEYPLGSYHREFRLSEDIDPGAVAAKMRAGVLELQLPKSEASRPRSVPVQAG